MSDDDLRARMDQIAEAVGKLDSKVDRLNDAVVMMARLEERQLNQQDTLRRVFRRLDNQDERIDSVEDRVHAVERKAGYTSWTVGHAAKVGWFLITAVIGTVASVIGYSFR